MSIALCVAGMHRSGTSLTTGWLARCGLAVADRRLLGPSIENPTGHFEDLDFVDLQQNAILAADPASRGWVVTESATAARLELDETAARHLVEARRKKFRVWGWKDPRTVHFMTAWRRLIPEMRALTVWRPCAEVVSSLFRRASLVEAVQKQIGHTGGDFLRIAKKEAEELWILAASQLLADYEANTATTLVVPLADVIAHDETVFMALNSLCEEALTYSPLANLFRPELLGGAKRKTADAPPPANDQVASLTDRLLAVSLAC